MNSKTSLPTEYIATMPLNRRHIWIVFVASLGQFLGTAVATLAGIIIPMINILRHPELSSWMQGLIGAADLIGIVVGSVIIGRLSDKYGYIFFFRFCPALVLVASLAVILFPSIPVLIIGLFVIGIGIGGEYSLDSDYISVLLPVKWRSFMIGVAKAGSAFGNIIVAGVCFLLIMHWREAVMWPELMWIITCIAALMLLCRMTFRQSPRWLMQHGRKEEAEKVTAEFLGRNVEIKTNPEGTPNTEVSEAASKKSLGAFIRENFPQVVLSGIPWACEGLGVYGIGVFLPILVIALGIEHSAAGELPILHVAASVKVTFYISCIILPGFIMGLWLIRRKYNISRIQTVGFWLCAISLMVLGLAFHFHWNKWISIGAFMCFELFLNMGPHLVTYVLPPRIYPVADRGQGTGIAASIGKIGAVTGVFIIPLLLDWGGPLTVLAVSALVMAFGAVVTSIYSRRVFGSKTPAVNSDYPT